MVEPTIGIIPACLWLRRTSESTSEGENRFHRLGEHKSRGRCRASFPLNGAAIRPIEWKAISYPQTRFRPLLSVRAITHEELRGIHRARNWAVWLLGRPRVLLGRLERVVH